MAKEFKEVSAQVEVDKLEREVLDFWEREKIFEKSLENTKSGEVFTFYDGPPYATGKPHYGHVLQSALKDTVLRYKTMQGYHVPRQVGWDTHGLPVEVLVEKELGLKTKQDVEKYGVAEFNQKCREAVFKYVDEFTNTLKRIGRWADYENAYATLNLEYMDKEWGVFKQLWDQDLVYKDFRSTPYCVRCATPLSNFEVNMAYKDKTDRAVYALLKIQNPNDKFQNTYSLIWTTTPWTLPANIAVAYGKDLDYVSVRHEDKEVILAKDRVEAVFGKDVEIVKEWSHEELEKLIYEPLYGTLDLAMKKDKEDLGEEAEPADLFSKQADAYSLVAADHVTADDGSGLVHIAPAFGTEDFEVGKKYGLPSIRTVDGNGKFIEGSPLGLAGMRVFDSNKKIAKDLEERGLLFKQEKYKHSYPHCWRCDEPLIYYALDTWFIRVTSFKDKMLKNNEDIHWIPEHVKNGRFGKGLESAPDWAVSRNRFWSTPMPIWECEECGERVCVGSVDDLKQFASVDEVKDLHRPYVDELTWDCEECGGEMKRILEVLDVWFDSGSMPYATGQELPADFIVEAIEMTRAWFYVMHVLATALYDKPAYKNVIASGIIFAEDGKKLSKKFKNYPEIMPTLEQYGADVLRIYLLTSSSLGEPYRFSESDLRKLSQNVYRRLWNVYSFFVRYALVAGFKSDDSISNNILDLWVLARTAELEREVIKASDNYQIDVAARQFVSFIDDLSNWYVRRSRDRFHPSTSLEEDKAAFTTLYDVLVRLSKIMAPFMPFLADEMFRNLVGEDSVHLERLSEVSEVDENILDEMKFVREIVTQGLALRAEAKIKVRQPLAKLTIEKEISEEFKDMIKDEVNVKEVVVGDKLELDIEITPELRSAGLAREIIRHGQMLRKEAGYELDDRIKVGYETDGELAEVLKDRQQEIAEALQGDELVALEELEKSDAEIEVKIEGEDLKLGLKKVK